jgi:hypothetical protein
MASRFRAAEIDQYVDALQQKGPPMPANLPHGSPAPVVHLHQPQGPWQAVAVWGTLVAQFCLLAIIAWKMIGADSPPTVAQQPSAAAARKRDAAVEAEFLDRVVQQLRDTPEGFTDRMRAEFLRARELEQRLTTEQRQHQALLNEMDADRDAAKGTIKSLESQLAKRDHQVELLQNRLADAQAEVEQRDEQLAAAGLGKKKAKDADSANEKETAQTAAWRTPWVFVTAGIAGLLALACVVAAVSWRRKGDLEDELERSAQPPMSSDLAAGDHAAPDRRGATFSRSEIDSPDEPAETSRGGQP